MKLFYSLFVLIFASSSCTYDQAEKNAFDALACDTSNVRYSVEIKNILETSCKNCHFGDAAEGAGKKLDSYVEVKKYVDQNKLLESVLRTGDNYMPLGGNRLSACKIEQIRNWIKKGAPNN
jgi:hypothetical protein